MNHLEVIKQELKALKPELSERFYVSDIGLFGSITRTDFNDASDVDIIVDFTQPIGIEFIDLADFLETNIKRKVDLISKNGLKANFYAKIEKEIQYV
jgi:predicted nucleotidyltransferase